MNHEHDYRFVYNKREWVPVQSVHILDKALFQSVEYAFLMCKCTEVIKVEVKTQEKPSGKKVTGKDRD